MQAGTIAGNQLILFTLISIATFQFHATAAELSLIPISLLLPFVIGGPIAGALIDRLNIRWTIMAANAACAFVAIALLWSPGIRTIHLGCFFLGIAGTVLYPAQAIVLRRFVATDALLSMNGLIFSTMLVSQIASPLAGGWLLRLHGSSLCFGLDSALFLAAAFTALSLSPGSAEDAGKPAGPGALRSIRIAIEFIIHNERAIFIVVAMTLGLFAINFVGVLLSIYVRDTLRLNIGTFAILDAVLGTGMLAGAQILPSATRKLTKIQVVVLGLAGSGIAAIVLATVQSITSILLNMLIAGISLAFITISSETVLLQETPENIVGCVSSNITAAICFFQLVGMASAAPLVHLVGIAGIWSSSGIVLIVLAAVGWRKMPRSMT
jgi:MFS family permease